MLARIFLFVLIAAQAKLPKYVIEDVSTIELSVGDWVELYSPLRPNSPNTWVIGRFPSHRIAPFEGRLGDRNFNTKDTKGNHLQKFTIMCNSGQLGEELPMDFWYIRPQYAEQYYNDPSAYEAMHEEVPETKIITFKIVKPGL